MQFIPWWWLTKANVLMAYVWFPSYFIFYNEMYYFQVLRLIDLFYIHICIECHKLSCITDAKKIPFLWPKKVCLSEIKYYLLFVAMHCEWVIDRPATIDHLTLHPCFLRNSLESFLSSFLTIFLSKIFSSVSFEWLCS